MDTTGGNVYTSCRDRRQCGHVTQRQEAMWTRRAETGGNVDVTGGNEDVTGGNEDKSCRDSRQSTERTNMTAGHRTQREPT